MASLRVRRLRGLRRGSGLVAVDSSRGFLTLRAVVLVVFQPIEVLVTLAAYVAAVRLVFFDPFGAGIRAHGVWIDNGEGTVFILLQCLGLMTVLRQVSRQHSSLLRNAELTSLWYFRPF